MSRARVKPSELKVGDRVVENQRDNTFSTVTMIEATPGDRIGAYRLHFDDGSGWSYTPGWYNDNPMFIRYDRTPEEIKELKLQWINDPAWDIENTEGFEAHREELLEFSTTMKFKWARDRELRIKQKAEDLGIPGNLKLAEYVMNLEARIDTLEMSLIPY